MLSTISMQPALLELAFFCGKSRWRTSAGTYFPGWLPSEVSDGEKRHAFPAFPGVHLDREAERRRGRDLRQRVRSALPRSDRRRAHEAIRRPMKAFALMALLAASHFAFAADVPPAPPGADITPPRLSFVDGKVSFWRPGAEDWAPARVNTPPAGKRSLPAGRRNARAGKASRRQRSPAAALVRRKGRGTRASAAAAALRGSQARPGCERSAEENRASRRAARAAGQAGERRVAAAAAGARQGTQR